MTEFDGRPLDENPDENPQFPETELPQEDVSEDDAELLHLLALKRHGQLTNATDQNRLEELLAEAEGETDGQTDS